MSANKATTAFEHWASLPPKEFAPKLRFYSGEDCVTFFLNENRCFAQRVSEVVTVFTDVATGELVGFKVKGIRKILCDAQSLEATP